MTRSASERVADWHREWLESDEPHWGDRMAWNTADEIARRLDQPENPDDANGVSCLKAGDPASDHRYCTLEAGHEGPCHTVGEEPA